MDVNVSVVLDKSKAAKAVHEEVDPGPRSADHLGKHGLTDLRDAGFRVAVLLELRHHEQDARETPLAAIKELIYKVGLRSHTAGQQISKKHSGKGMLFVNHTDHLASFDSQRGTSNHCSRRRETLSGNRRNGLLTDEVSLGQDSDGRFLSFFRQDRQLRPAGLKVKEAVRRITLRKKRLLGLEAHDLPALAGLGQKAEGRKLDIFQWLRHG